MFDPGTGEPAALLDGTVITAIRTGACSALSARLLARPDADVLAILGTGVQARSHARAMCRVRPIREIRIAGRDQAKATALAAELSGALPAEVRMVPAIPEALARRHPRLRDHPRHRAGDPPILAEPRRARHVGGLQPGGPEIDDATIRDALVCVESA